MKLIDILVERLPDIGGWPIDSDDARTLISSLPGVSWGLNGGGYYAFRGPNDSITYQQYEAALAASKTEWDGEGLPPVGCECEWQDKNTKLWFPVVIAYSSEWVTVVRELKPLKVGDAVECCINNFGEEERLHFRPIRSEADKKRDEAIESMASLIDYRSGCSAKPLAKWLFEEIAAGKIPHIRID